MYFPRGRSNPTPKKPPTEVERKAAAYEYLRQAISSSSGATEIAVAMTKAAMIAKGE